MNLLIILVLLLLLIIILFIYKFLLFTDKELFNKIKNIKYTDSFIIPKKIHQIWFQGYDNLTIEVKNIIEHNLKINPEWEYVFWDSKKIDNFIKNNESDYVYNAYNKINSAFNASRADFFRYIIMYHQGGVYLDIKSKINYPLDNWVHNDKLQLSFFGSKNILLKKYFTYNKKFKNIIPRELQQIVLIYPKKHPILRILIDYISQKIYNYKNKNFIFFNKRDNNAYNVLSLTGPWVYTKILSIYIYFNDCIIVYNNNGNKNEIYNGFILYDGTSGKYHKLQHNKKIHYLDQHQKLILK